MKITGSIKIRLLVTSVVVLALALSFSAALQVDYFEKLYVESQVSFFTLLGEDIKRNIESALHFGKPIHKLRGMEKILAKPTKHSLDLENITVSLPGGEILYSLSETDIPPDLEEKIATALAVRTGTAPDPADPPTEEFTFNSILHGGIHHVLLPVLQKGTVVARIDLSFPESSLRLKIEPILKLNLKLVLILAVVAALLLTLSFKLLLDLSMPFKQLRFRIYLILIVVIGGTQATSAVMTTSAFEKTYIEATKATVFTLARILGDDIELLLAKGIRLERLRKIDTFLESTVSATPEVENIRIEDRERKTLYLAGSEAEEVRAGGGEKYEIDIPLKRGDDIEGRIMITLSEDYIGTHTKELALNSVTVLIISIILVSELILFLLAFLKRQLKGVSAGRRAAAERSEDPSEEGEQPRRKRSFPGVIRPAAFLYLFAASLPLSFLPLHMGALMERASTTSTWISNDILLGLPISAEMFLAALGILIGGSQADRQGWQRIFFTGIVISALGAVLSALAAHPGTFIVGRGVAGLGYGLTWMSFQCFIFANTDSRSKAGVLAALTAGLFSGILCGSAAGGMLADTFGFSTVFAITAALLVLPILFASLFLREFFLAPKKPAPSSEAGTSASTLVDFFTDRNVFSLVLFASVPAAICFTGFIYYALPIYLKESGYTQANIARLIMVYGLMMIFLAPPVNRLVDRLGRRKIFISTAGILGGLGLGAFHFFGGFWAAATAVVMLGISSSVGLSAQTIFAVELPVSRRVGEGTAMGAYRFLQRMGQVLGPLSVGAIFASGGMEEGLATLGGLYLCVTFLFILTATEKGRKD
jgi:MFS family permease